MKKRKHTTRLPRKRYGIFGEVPAAESIQGQYLTNVAPELLRQSRYSTIITLETSLRHFTRFAGIIPLDEVDSDLTDSFLGWLVKSEGITQEIAKRYAERVRYVCRKLGSDKCPSRRTPPKRPPNPPVGSLWEFFEKIYRPHRMLDACSATIDQYRVMFNRLDLQHGREIKPEELTDDFLIDHMRWMLDDENLSPATVNNARTKIVALWRYAYKRKLVDELPDVRRLKEYHQEPDAWTPQEVQSILAACLKQKGHVGSVPASSFFHALILVFLNTGLRRRAVLAIRRSDIDFTNAILRVPAENSKNKRGKKYRLLPVTLQAIKAIYERSGEKLFSYPQRIENMPRRYKRILKQAGLPSGRRNMFHKLRRCVATTIAEAAGIHAAMEYLDHQNLVTTRRYVDPSQLSESDMTPHLQLLIGGVDA